MLYRCIKSYTSSNGKEYLEEDIIMDEEWVHLPEEERINWVAFESF